MKLSFIYRFLFPALLLAVALTACNRAANPANPASLPERSDNPDSIADLSEIAVRWADSVMAGMSLEERVGQLLMPALYASDSAPELRRLREYAADMHVGGVILLKGDREGATAIARILNQGSAAIPFIAMDAEWGLGMRLTDMPVYPANGQLRDDLDESVLYEYGQQMARECRDVGVNMVLGPVADLSGREGLLGKRSFGSDPRKVARMTVAYSRGLEDGNVVSVAKHFPGHGSPTTDSHRALPVISRSREQMDSLDLVPFRAYIESGMSGIMSGHLAVPSIDPSGRPASFSRELLTNLLREDLGFRGLILTDALNMGGAEGYDAVDALLAGADIVLAPADTRAEQRSLLTAVRSGRLPLPVVNDRLRRILFRKYFLTLPAGNPPPTIGPDSLRRLLR